MTSDPFRALGLIAGPDLTDDDIRAAWRRIAAAAHPDRADGGDPPAFAAAAAAYSDLRTPFGRREALADLGAAKLGVAGYGGRIWHGRAWRGRVWRGRIGRGRIGRVGLVVAVTGWAARVRRGRPARLALRVLVAVAFGALVLAVAGWQPATPALMLGALIWLIRGGHRDLAAVPPPEPDGRTSPL
jgi:hypothetical protein